MNLKAFGIPYFGICFALMGLIIGMAFEVSRAEDRLLHQRVRLASEGTSLAHLEIGKLKLRVFELEEAQWPKVKPEPEADGESLD